MLPLLIFDAFYFHDEWGPNELSHTTESETGLIPIKYKCHRNICSTDYGHTKAKSLILCGSNSNPNSQINIWDVDIKA